MGNIKRYLEWLDAVYLVLLGVGAALLGVYATALSGDAEMIAKILAVGFMMVTMTIVVIGAAIIAAIKSKKEVIEDEDV